MPEPTRRFARPAVARACIALALCVGVLAGTSRSRADQITDQINGKQQQQGQLSGVMNALRQQIAVAQDKEAVLRGVIAALDAQISAQQRSITDATATLTRITEDLDTQQQRLEQTRAHLASDKQALAVDMVLIYKLGIDAPVNNLLRSDNFNEFWQRLIDLRRVSGSQQTVVNSVHQEETSVTALVADISQKKAAQAQVLASLRGQEQALEAARNDRVAAQAQLVAVQAADQQRLADAERAAKELTDEIAALQAAEAAAQAAARRRGGGNGHFSWPLLGPLSQGFGCTTYPFEPYDPACPSRHFHSGIDIVDNWGAPVAAADAGIAYTYTSAYGYGNHVIIVHGNGWVSVYGHLSSFAVGNNVGVGRGQVIGYEGSTGNSTGPHLHFEVRLNDVPRDPLQYLP